MVASEFRVFLGPLQNGILDDFGVQKAPRRRLKVAIFWKDYSVKLAGQRYAQN